MLLEEAGGVISFGLLSAVITTTVLKLHSTCASDHCTHRHPSAFPRAGCTSVLSAFPGVQQDRCEKLCVASATSPRGRAVLSSVFTYSLASHRASQVRPTDFEHPIRLRTGSLTAVGSNVPATKAEGPNPQGGIAPTGLGVRRLGQRPAGAAHGEELTATTGAGPGTAGSRSRGTPARHRTLAGR